MEDSTEKRSLGVLGILFYPAIAAMNRLRYAWKFVLIGVLALAPLLYLLYLQFRGTTETRDFSAKEIVGIEYIQPATGFLHNVQRRRVLEAAVLAGNAAARGPLKQATADADAKAAQVDVVEARAGGDLKTTEKWRRIKAAWAKIKDTSAKSFDESDAAHEEITSLVVDLILNDAGNNSNLILDPDLDSYWLMDAFVAKLPALGERVSTSAARALRPAGEGAAFGKVVDLSGQLRLVSDTSGDLVNTDMKTAFKESTNPKYGQSPTLVARLESPVKTTQASVDTFLAGTKGVYLVEKAEPSRAQADKTMDQALAALGEGYALHDKIGPELRWLCQRRVDIATAQRTYGLVAAAAALGVLGYLFVGFYLSVRSSARSLADATKRMIAGTAERFVPVSRDELGGIADEYNLINAALVEARRLRQKVEAENAELQENIMDLLQVVSDASDGDLRVRAKVTEGALGNVADAFNQLVESLQRLMAEIQEQFTRSNAAVAAISAASKTMADGATHQSREIVSASQLVERMNAEIARVTENAEVAAGAAKRTEESANLGAEGAQNVIAGMTSLRANVQAGAKKMKNLGDRSMEITGIVGTIARISEQTNMLALNAAIEAARAGEHGRGFSVVAEEVRKLAERTANATQEIDKLVKAIHGETNETISAIERQTEIVETQAALVGKTGDSLAQIRAVSTESASLVSEISNVAKQQVEGTATVVKTMGQISSIAADTQANAEKTVSTISELLVLSEQLSRGISRFKVAS